MRKKILYVRCLILFAVLFCFKSVAFASDEKTKTIMEDGWGIEENQIYYVENGIKVLGEKSIDGYWYYFDEINGHMQTGFVNHHNKNYYYDVYGRMQYGEKAIEGYWYYFDPIYGTMAKGWTNHHGNRYYYDECGHMLYGEQEIDGASYLFDTITGVMKTGWVQRGESKYYYTTEGIVTGEKAIDGYWYYFDEITGQMQSGFVNHHDKNYYYDDNGRMQYDEKAIDGYWYYFDPIYGTMAKGWTNHHGNRYYYDENGHMLYGEHEIDGEFYDFHPYTGVMKTGWIERNQNKYYYTLEGIVKGEKAINGYWYYFDEITGVMQTGFVDHHDKHYYYDSYGRMQYGDQCIADRWYYFDPVYGKMDRGWIEEEGKIFYFYYGENYTGEISIGGYWYYFDPDKNGEMATGWYDHHEHTYYYDVDGRMQYGWCKIGEEYFYFHRQTGIYAPEFVAENGKKYYRTESGENYSGEISIDGYWYYFDPDKNGEMATGWSNHHERTYYYDDEGRMQYSFQVIDGEIYYFHEITGVMQTGWQTVNGNLYYFYSDGKMAVDTRIDDKIIGSDGIAVPDIEAKINEIKKYIGTPYRWGGNTPSGWDCSGFTQWALGYLGVSIQRTAAMQAQGGIAINPYDMSLWKPGDVICYANTSGRISHAALYIGNGQLMHALNTKVGTTIHGVDYYERLDVETYRVTVRRYL